MRVPRGVVAGSGVVVGVMIVAGCTGSSNGNGDTTPSATQTVTTTATATDTVSSAAPPTGSGVPASSTAPAPTGSRSGGSGQDGTTLCTPTVMRFQVTANDGAAGSVYFEVRATNGSSSPCVTTGFPGLAFLDAGGHKLLDASRGAAATAKTLVVQPGQVVSAQVRAESVNAQNGGTPCPSSPRFLLTMPDNTDSTTITHTTPACSVSVAAFVRGPGV